MLAIIADITEPFDNSESVTEFAAICAAVTASSAILAVSTAPLAILAALTVPSPGVGMLTADPICTINTESPLCKLAPNTIVLLSTSAKPSDGADVPVLAF